MKVLLIGPYPPPHGGISVHVLMARQALQQAGVSCRVLNLERKAPANEDYRRVRGAFGLMFLLILHAWTGWTLHLHVSGHNRKSWLIAALCGLVGQMARGVVVTLHSGMAPDYLSQGTACRRILARLTCSLYDRILCVNPVIEQSIARLGIAAERLNVLPAFLPTVPPRAALPDDLRDWIDGHRPVLSTTLVFRPEYGFELLVQALAQLRRRYPQLGCLIIGGDQGRDEAMEWVQRMQLEGSVRLLGDVPHDLCLSLIFQSDLYIRPTLADGDAISVREALSLNVPVVASDVGQRPTGTALFEVGSLEDMVGKIEATLNWPRRRYRKVGAPPQLDGTQTLMQIYEGVRQPRRFTRKVGEVFVLSPAYYLKRLRQMNGEEICYRLWEKVRCRQDRLQLALGKNPTIHKDPLPEMRFKDYFRNNFNSRFYLPATPEGRKRVVRFVSDYFPDWIEDAVEEAERLCRHRVELLGHGELNLGPEIDWHKDPVSGHRWPVRFRSNYDPVRDCRAGDPKVIHEVNRHQHLPRLAKVFFLTGEERYAREVITQIEDWIDQNPPGFGINWQSSLEIALRSISWLWTIFFLLDSEQFSEDRARRIGMSLFNQLDHVYRNPSLFSSPNTHLLGEAAALFLAGLLFTDLERSAQWLERGRELLVQGTQRQVLRDGVHAELSSYYHCYALDFYLQALTLARRCGFDFPDCVWDQVSRMLEFVMHLTRGDGSIPLLGDDDGGRALALSRNDYRCFRDALCTAAVLLQRSDFKYQAGEFSQETFWLLGEEGWRTYLSLRSEPPAVTFAAFRNSGYFIQRSGWSKRDSHLVFDCGDLGMLSGGHGHADALSLVLSVGDRELLIDPGTLIYNGSLEWRDFFRSTRAHNTVMVDNRDQSIPAGTFRWKRKFRCSPKRELAMAGFDYVEGEHDGYASLKSPLMHRRRVLFIRPEYWLVLDDFRGKGEHTFDVHYHFAPGTEILLLQDSNLTTSREVLAWNGGASLKLFITASEPLKVERICGRSSPLQGWRSSRYGAKSPSPTLLFRFRARVPALMMTVLIPQAGAGAPFTSAPSPRQALTCRLAHREYEDTVMFSPAAGRVETAYCKGRGELFWLRTKGETFERLLALNAFEFSHHGTPILESPKAVTWFATGSDGHSSRKAPLELGENRPCVEFAGL